MSMTPQEVTKRFDITYRQLDHWTTKGYLGDDLKTIGVGARRVYTAKEVTVIERMLLLRKAGVEAETASKIAKGETEAYNQLADALEACT